MIELLLIPLAFIMEMIDSSLGMMYGTLLSPLLIGLGFDPLLVIPSILVSQALGGLVGTFSHHKFKNADFNGLTKHTKVTLAIVLPGLIAAFVGVFLAVRIPRDFLRLYVGILVILMGVLCLTKFQFRFKWWKIYLIGVISSFNKAFSGGGFGPITSAGKILGGLDPRASIATTTYAEFPICLTSFLLYVSLNGIPNVYFPLYLSIGAILGGLAGPYLCSKFKIGLLRKIVGLLAILSGMWILFRFVI